MTWVQDISDVLYTIDTVKRQSNQASKVLSSATQWNISKIPRVTQLDAIRTQRELRNILMQSLFKVFAIAPLTSIPYSYKEEICLALDLTLFRFSTFRLGGSVGDRLHNLVLQDQVQACEQGLNRISHLEPSCSPSRGLLALYAILDIVVPYLGRKVQQRCLEENWAGEDPSSLKCRLAKGIRYLNVIWSTLCLVNVVHFLSTGHYRTLVERMLNLRVVHGSQQVMRITNVVFLNQLVLTQAIKFLLEVFHFGKIIQKLTQCAYSMTHRREMAPENRCCACYQLPTLGQRSNCGHLYCYYCIKSRLFAGEVNGSFSCLRCGKDVFSSSPDKL